MRPLVMGALYASDAPTPAAVQYDKDGNDTLTLEEFSQLMADQELYSKFTLPFY